jgi:outer membrane receptor protein involved in Fe transport
VTRTSFSVVEYPSIRRDSNELVAEWSNVITLTRKDKLTAGALFNRIQGAETIVSPLGSNTDAKGSRPGGAFYAQIEHQFRDDLKFIAGLQTNKIGSIPLDTVPRAGLIWTPASWVSLKALYGKAFRAPSLDETLISHPGLRGNPALLPEKAGTFDLGAGFKGARFEIGFDYFHSVQTNAITAVTQQTYAQYVNIGRLTFDGGEMEGKYYFAKNFFGQGSMLYQTNISNTGQTNVTPLPNLSFKAGVSYENRRGLTLGLFNLSDGPINAFPGTVNPVQGAHNVLNANFRYDLSRYLSTGDRQKLAVVAHGNNLTNRQEWLPGWGFNSIDSIPVQQGRVLYIGLEYSAGRN